LNGIHQFSAIGSRRFAAGAVLLALSLLAEAWGPVRAQDLLEPEDAFRFEARMVNAETLEVTWRIAEDHYMYQHAFSVRAPEGGVVLGEPEFPPGKETHDEFFGDVVTYESVVTFPVHVTPIADGLTGFTVEAGGQGCNEPVGICYPPMIRTASIAMPPVRSSMPQSSILSPSPDHSLGASLESLLGDGPGEPDFEKTVSPGVPRADAAMAAPAAVPPLDDESGPRSGYWPVLLALGMGVLLTFTPCVLPMIPILAGIIVGQGGSMTRLRGGALASVYVLGTAATYTAVGVVAGLTGDQLQAYFQNIWAIGFVAALLVLMALSMFGFYELSMPSSIQTRLQHRAMALNAGAFGGVFLMGMVSALIVGACVSPILISILGLAINRGDPVLGGATMFAMALGMGVFLVAMGFGFGHLLPRAGAWMERVKHAFGVMLLAVAVYLLGAIPEVPVLYLWAVLLLGIALYLGVHGVDSGSLGRRMAKQGTVIALVAWAVLAALGGLQGSRDILRPVDLAAPGGESRGEPAVHAQFQRVPDRENLARLMDAARAQGRPVMVDYYADWCVDCVRMERTTFTDPRVARMLNERFVLLQVDVTDPNDPGTRAIKQDHGVFGPPAMLFFGADGAETRSMRRYGYMDKEAFLRHIEPLVRE
jgi:thioredoxin:protein disulfide reductase